MTYKVQKNLKIFKKIKMIILLSSFIVSMGNIELFAQSTSAKNNPQKHGPQKHAPQNHEKSTLEPCPWTSTAMYDCIYRPGSGDPYYSENLFTATCCFNGVDCGQPCESTQKLFEDNCKGVFVHTGELTNDVTCQDEYELGLSCCQYYKK